MTQAFRSDRDFRAVPRNGALAFEGTLHYMPGGVKRPSAASQPPSANNIVPVT